MAHRYLYRICHTVDPHIHVVAAAKRADLNNRANKNRIRGHTMHANPLRWK